MSELSMLKEAFSSGTTPSGANAKKFEKLLKKYEHIVNPMFVHLYPVRDCRYDDTTYRVFAIPVNNDSIDGETLEAIKEEINALPLGSIRYNAASTGERPMNIEDVTGKYLNKEEDTDDVMAVSNYFDGITIFTMAVVGSKVCQLDCEYAVLGKWDGTGFGKWANYMIIPIENTVIGKECDITQFPSMHLQDTAVNPDSSEGRVVTASNRYMQIMQYVMYALIAAGAVWYFFLR